MHVPDKDKNGERRYGQWSGHENGVAEDKNRCIMEFRDRTSWATKQCLRKRGHGPGGEFCKQHAKIVERWPNV